MMMAVSLYTNRPNKYNVVQAITSIQMWKCGASNKVCLIMKSRIFNALLHCVYLYFRQLRYLQDELSC